MAHPLEKQVAAIRNRVRSILALFGLGWVVAYTLGALMILGLADYWIHFQDPGIRIICTGLVLATFLWTAYRYLVVPLSRRALDVDVALRIERRFPELAERLSSAVEFLKQPENDPEAGSPALRRAVIAKATAQVDSLNLGEVLDRRPATNALLAAIAVALLAILACVLDVSAARIALARLANPLGSTAWPKQNNLEFKNPPSRLASGQPFEVELVDKNDRLPRQVRIHYRYLVDGRPADEEVAAMQFIDGVMLARRENVRRPFQYRAEGGDDNSMAWHDLEVVDPPQVESFEITLHPPDYTGLPPVKSDKRIRAWQGTGAEITGTVTKPLVAAAVELESGKVIDAIVSDGGYRFRVPAERMQIEESGAYWFVLTDAEKLIGGSDTRWDIQALVDTPPSVTIEQPSANIFVTPDAVVSLKILVKDNLAIRDVELRYSRSDRSDEGEFVMPLFTGPAKPPAPAEATGADRQLGESRLVEHDWSLAELALPPGTQLAIHAHASDYVPQTGQSTAPRRITIITKEELEDRIAQRQSLILSELARALKMQRAVRSQTTALEIQHKEVGVLAKRDIDDLQAAELNQRQVTRTLTSPSEGIPTLIHSLLDDLASNNVDSPDIERRMRGFLSEIDRLDRDALPLIRRELTGAMKSAQARLQDPDSVDDRAVGTSLELAGRGEDEVIETLERLLGDLSQWADYRRFARDMRHLLGEQRGVQAATAKIGKQTLTKDLTGLTPRERAELKKQAERQFELARRFDKMLENMQEMQAKIAEDDPLAAATLDDALHTARSEAVGGLMRAAGRHVEQNQVGQAVGQQGEVATKLEQLLDILSNRREHELHRLVAKLREAEKDLLGLRQQQRGLRKKMDEAGQLADPQERRQELQRLAKRQRELQEEIDRMARRLKRLQADRAGRSAERGAAKQGQAGQAAEAGNAAEAGKQAEAAEKDLDEAQQQLAEARRQAEQDLAQEQLARFEDAVRGMKDIQQRVLDETRRLAGLREAQGRLTRAQALSLGDLAGEQEQLKDETTGYAKKMSQTAVFQLALEGAARDMADAEERLRRQETGDLVQRSERNVLARLDQLLEAFAEDEKEKGKDGQDEQGGGSGGQQGGQNVHDIAELKLLKLLQQDINRRTSELEQALADGPPTPTLEREFSRLSAEQGQLADLIFNLIEPTDDVDDPEALPDIRKQDSLDDDLPKFDLEEAP